MFDISVLKLLQALFPVLTFLTDLTDLQMRKRTVFRTDMPVLTIGQYRPVLLFEAEGLTKTPLRYTVI